MAVIVLPCPKCPARCQFDEMHRGKKGKCKKCGTTFVIGDGSSKPLIASDSKPAPAAPALTETDTTKNRPCGADGIPLVWEPGDDILGQYEVRKFDDNKPFIEGGMGRVNRVWHKAWQRDLVVKNIKPPRPPAVLRPSTVENFLREAEVWVDKLGLHPNIVCCHYVRVLAGLPRVFVEFVDGGDLATWIRSGKLYEGGARRALERILDIGIQLAWGLHYTHEQGLVHQDMKPRNVMMTKDGVAKVTDFGLARARAVAEVGDEEVPLRSDVTGLPGTQSYQSPEQAAGKRLTPASDLWSWGVSLWHMFLGEVECGLGAEALKNLNHFVAAQDKDDRCPEMPPDLIELLRSCFEHEPEERPRNMLEVAGELQSIYQQTMGQPYPREKPNPAEALADTLNNRAVSLFDLGKKADAEQKWQEALRVDPQHPEATYNWGLIQWRSGRMTDMRLLERLREVRTSSADSARVDYLIGLVHLERTDVQAAVDLLSKAVEAGTNRTEIASTLALAQSLCDPSEQLPRTFQGHSGKVNSVSWSPDGRFALSGSNDKTLRLWEVSSGQCLRAFQGHTSAVNSVSWSPDGHYVLSGSWDKTLRLWEVSSGQCLRTFQKHTGWVHSVSWSPDGRYVLSGGGDRSPRLWEVSSDRRISTLRLWEVSSGQCLRTFEGHTSEVKSVSWSPDGRFALSGSDDKTLHLWEVSSGQCLRTFEGHTDFVNSVSWSPDGRYALSGSDDKTLRLWEVSSGQCLRTFQGHTGGVKSVSWSPDGRYALSGGNRDWYLVRSDDKTLHLWEVSSGQCLRTFHGHEYEVNSVSWSPDGRYVLLGNGDSENGGYTLCLWGFAFAKQPVHLVTSMAFAASSTLYHHLLQQVRDTLARNPAVAAGLLQQARQQPGCSRREETLDLARPLSRSLAHRSFVEGWEKRTFEGHTDFVNSVSWSPDGRFALSGSDDKTLRLWEVSSGQCLRTFQGHTDGVNSVSWSPDGRYALSGSADDTLRLWEVSSGRCLRTFQELKGSVKSVSWSPDGRYALSGSSDDTLHLWEVSGGQCLRTFRGHTYTVNSVSWSPDGHYALSGSKDKTLRLWELDWEFELNQPADWDEGARSFVQTFLTLRNPGKNWLGKWKRPQWTEEDFHRLLDRLGCAGFGWLRPEGVHRELQKMASTWQGPPPLIS